MFFRASLVWVALTSRDLAKHPGTLDGIARKLLESSDRACT